MSQLRSTSLGMFEGAVLLCGLLGIRADAQFKWRDQCSNMLAVADGRANAASAAASIDFMRFKSFFYVCANASFTHAAQPFDRRLPCG